MPRQLGLPAGGSTGARAAGRGDAAMLWPSAEEAALHVVTAAQRPGRVRIRRGPQARLHQKARLARAWGGAQGSPVLSAGPTPALGMPCSPG